MITAIDNITNERIAKILSSSEGLNLRIYQKYKNQILAQYKIALSEIQLSVAEMYEKYGDDVELGDMLKFNRLKNLEEQVKEQINILNRKNHRVTAKAIKETYSTNYYFNAFAYEKSLGMKLGFGLLSPKKIEAAILNPLDRITWISRETEHGRRLLKFVKEEITQGLIRGKGYAKTAKAIRKRVERSASNVVRVVQTESHRAQIQGNIASFEKMQSSFADDDIKLNRVWLATLDSKTRDRHRKLDGKAADNDGMWKIDGLTTSGPGLFGIEEEDINCRCDLITKIEGYDLEKRKNNESKEIIKYKNYSEWFEGRIKK